MKVDIETLAPCRQKMKVEVSSDAVIKEYNDIVEMYSKSGKIPGFRKGNAPKKIVEGHYAKDIEQDAKDRMVPQFYRSALEEKSIRPVAVIGVEDVKFNKTEGISFNVTFDVPPSFKLPKYKKIHLKADLKKVEEKDIETALMGIRERASRYEDIEGRPAAKGDLALIDYTGTIDGVAISEEGPAASSIGVGKDFWALMNEPMFIPGVLDGLVGMNIDEEKTLDVTFPDDFRVPSVAGKTASYHIKLKALREKIIPPINDEILSLFELKTEDELRQKIREELEKTAKVNEENRLKNDINTYLLEKTQIEVPQSLVSQETAHIVQSMVRRFQDAGSNKSEIEAQKEQIYNSASKLSLDRIKLLYILKDIAKVEKQTVEDSEYEDKVKELAEQYRMTPEQFKSKISENDGMESIKSDILSEKVLKFLLDNAKIK